MNTIEAWVEELSSGQGEAERLEQSQRIQELEHKNSELNDTVINLKTICEIQQEETLEDSRREIAQLEARVQELRRRQKEITAKFEDAQLRQVELQEEKKIADLQAVEFADKNVELQGKNVSLTQDVEVLTTRFKQQEIVLRNNEELTMEITALKANISTLQSQLSAEKDSIKQETELLKVQLESADEGMQKAMADSIAKDVTITDLTVEIARLHEQNTSLTESMTSLTMQQEDALQSADALKREKTALEETLQSQVSEKVAILNENTTLQERLDNTEENMQTVITDLEAKNATIYNLRMELQQTQNQVEQVTLKYQSNESLHKELGMQWLLIRVYTLSQNGPTYSSSNSKIHWANHFKFEAYQYILATKLNLC